MAEARLRRIGLLAAAFIALIATVVTIRSATSGDPNASRESVVVPDPAEIFDPTTAGEQLPPGYRLLLDRDRIAPVYNPTFTSASGVDWPLDSLVIGVAAEGNAKAYPVTHLNSREMVIDSLAGIPILVTW